MFGIFDARGALYAPRHVCVMINVTEVFMIKNFSVLFFHYVFHYVLHP